VQAGMWWTLVSVITTLYYVAIIFHRRVWYHVPSLAYVCIRCSGIILIPQATMVPNFISFTTSIAELAHGEKSCTQSITLPAYLICREPKHVCFKVLAFRKIIYFTHNHSLTDKMSLNFAAYTQTDYWPNPAKSLRW